MTPDYLQDLTEEERALHHECIRDVLTNGKVYELPIKSDVEEHEAFSRALADLIRASR